MKAKQGNTVFIGVRVPQDLADRLAEYCRQSGTSASEAVRQLLTTVLSSSEERAREVLAIQTQLSSYNARIREMENALKATQADISTIAHGGMPLPLLQKDMEDAMDPGKRRGKK
jgi:metal-responsive CopG/Arc/MetJ family transcriptional regulator